jgi:hypothetical protein
VRTNCEGVGVDGSAGRLSLVVMLTQSILLTAVLASPPTSTPTDVAPPDFSERLHSVDVTVSDSDVVIDALDRAGEPIGSLALWVDAAGTTWIAVDFSDGGALFGIEPGSDEVRRESTLAPEVAGLRLEAMLAHLDGAVEDTSWGECGWKAAVAGIGCATARPFMCVVGSIKAACACLPKLVQEFEDQECPYDL